MKKMLIAVDDSKGTKDLFTICLEMCSRICPETVVLCYVEKLEGRSFLDDILLSESEISTLVEALEGTEHQEALDKKAKLVLDYYTKLLQEAGEAVIKQVIRKGHPAEEILKTAQEEDIDLLMIGSRGSRKTSLLIGSVSREVVNQARVPVLVVKER